MGPGGGTQNHQKTTKNPTSKEEYPEDFRGNARSFDGFWNPRRFFLKRNNHPYDFINVKNFFEIHTNTNTNTNIWSKVDSCFCGAVYILWAMK